MTQNYSVHRAAWNMLKAHGLEAVALAEEAAEGLLRDEDQAGHELWLQVIEAICAISGQPIPASSAVTRPRASGDSQRFVK